LRIFAAQLATETNSFSPLPTGWAAFEAYGIVRGDTAEPGGPLGPQMALWRELAAADGHEFVRSVSAFAQPAGPTLGPVHRTLRGWILEDLALAMPVDMVLLGLHGAMVADGCDDCEGDLLARVRALVGPDVPVGAVLDPHCHLSPAMLSAATALIAFKEYPHTDILPRSEELYRLCADAAAGRTRPVTAAFDCRIVGVWPTTTPSMRGFVQEMQAAEGRDGILSVSLGHGFPWGDVADAGAKLWVVADGDRAGASVLAERLGRRFHALGRGATEPPLDLDLAIDEALAAPAGPVVMADVADNAGGGAPGDSTFVLRRLLERGVRDVASGCYWDPAAVALCREAGVGARFQLRIGGKLGPASGDPVDLMVEVMGLSDAHAQPAFDGTQPLGPSAWVKGEGIDLVLCSIRSQVFAPEAFAGLGLDPAARRLVVVKSTQHFHARFAPLAARILYVATPGAIAPSFGTIPYRKRSLAFWPRMADPFAA